ncbi:MAG: hypothetical protein OXG35_29745 [Acidobacteria bacterium]|nr:hypothetical protein [Acidobacteriota bacterium]
MIDSDHVWAVKFVDVIAMVGPAQGWVCGQCGEHVTPGSEAVSHVLAEMAGLPLPLPMLVHADCREGGRYVATWEKWRQREVSPDPEVRKTQKLGVGRDAVVKAVNFWLDVLAAGVDPKGDDPDKPADSGNGGDEGGEIPALPTLPRL